MPLCSRPSPVFEVGNCPQFRGGFHRGKEQACQDGAFMHNISNMHRTARGLGHAVVSIESTGEFAAACGGSHKFNVVMYECFLNMPFSKQIHDAACSQSVCLPQGKGYFA